MLKKTFLLLLAAWMNTTLLTAQKTPVPAKTNPPASPHQPSGNTRPPLPTYPPPQQQYSMPPNVLAELREGWNLSIGMNIGVSQLFHKIDFERTPMLDLYNFIKAAPSHSDYKWETFVEDYELNSTLNQPRFGFSGTLTYGEIPAFLAAEFMSSTSSYQKMAFSATVGLGKDVLFGESSFVSFKGGYKLVFQDSGFGAETLTNSVGNKEARDYMSRFFDPKSALGPPRGDLMTMRIGMGKYLGKDRRTCLGLETYGELDLTNETQRIARMNTLGLNLYINFVLF